tara:strand:+ start:1851 stop:2768 length:918 start_codon:yes stop_codon:yes gene_type:complete
MILDEEQYYISCRTDRYGSNAIPWIAAIYLSYISKRKLFHNTHQDKIRGSNRYKNTIIYNFLLENSETTEKRSIIRNDLLWNGSFDSNWMKKINIRGKSMEEQRYYHWGPYQIIKEIYNYKDEPFPDQFYNSGCFHKLKSKFHEKYDIMFRNNYDYNSICNSTLIHCRLDDTCKGEKGFVYQCFIGKQKLIKLINHCYKKFKCPVYLITNNDKSDKDFLIDIMKECNQDIINNQKQISNYIIGNDDVEFDIYIMMKCKNLIMSITTFPILSALLQDNTVYYTDDHFLLKTVLCKKKTDRFKFLEF